MLCLLLFLFSPMYASPFRRSPAGGLCAFLLTFAFLLLPGIGAAQALPDPIRDLRIENGELRWTAPANVARYGVQFYTGETTDRSQHFGGCSQAGADYTVRFDGVENYCGWTPGSVTRQAGATERLRPLQEPFPWGNASFSYVVYSYDSAGRRSAVSNTAVYSSRVPQESLQLWGPSAERFFRLKVGDRLLLTAGATEALHPQLQNWKSDQLACRSVPASFGGSQTINAKWECTALRSLISQQGNSEVYFTIGDQRSQSIVIQVDPADVPVSLPRITDLRIVDGELRWTAPANVSRYAIRFYTGETTSRTQSFGGCQSDIPQMQHPNGPGYCAGTAQVISRSKGTTERVRIDQSPVKSFVVSYFDSSGNQSAVSNVAVWKGAEQRMFCGFRPAGGGWQCEEMTSASCKTQRGTVFASHERCWSAAPSNASSSVAPPPAGYEDEVLTNIETYRNPFPDTSLHTLGGKAAAELHRRGILGGFPDGQFKGDRPVNRAEAAKFLLLARYGTVATVGNNGRFRDVKDGEWYVPYVVTAAQKGIIEGYGDGTFRPGQTVNTVEFLAMLARTFALTQPPRSTYTDVPADSWYVLLAGMAQQYTLFPSRTTRLFPDRALTREDVAVAIYQYLQNRSQNTASGDERGWHAYEDSRYGFSLRYPATWTLSVRANDGGNYALLFDSHQATAFLPKLIVKERWTAEQERQSMNGVMLSDMNIGSLKFKRITDAYAGASQTYVLEKSGTSYILQSHISNDATQIEGLLRSIEFR